MITSIVECSHEDQIMMGDEIFHGMMNLRKFMFDNVYFNETALKNEKKVLMIIENLYNLYLSRGDFKSEQEIVDYIAGMTDRYAISAFEEDFVPQSWNIKK